MWRFWVTDDRWLDLQYSVRQNDDGPIGVLPIIGDGPFSEKHTHCQLEAGLGDEKVGTWTVVE